MAFGLAIKKSETIKVASTPFLEKRSTLLVYILILRILEELCKIKPANVVRIGIPRTTLTHDCISLKLQNQFDCLFLQIFLASCFPLIRFTRVDTARA